MTTGQLTVAACREGCRTTASDLAKRCTDPGERGRGERGAVSEISPKNVYLVNVSEALRRGRMQEGQCRGEEGRRQGGRG